MAIKLILNISLVSAILIAPALLVLASWIRKGVKKPVFVWQRQELVIVTIVFFIFCLLFFIVGISFFFNYWGYLNSLRINPVSRTDFFFLGAASLLVFAALVMVYSGIRMILVQAVTEEGIIASRGMLPLAAGKRMIMWDEISDYYIVPDYPNLIYNFICLKDGKFVRYSIRVPIGLKENFNDFLEERMYKRRNIRPGISISSHNFSEN